MSTPRVRSKSNLNVPALYFKLIGASVRARMQYKLDFVFSTFIQAAMGLYDYLLIAAILWKFRTINGWDIYEVGVLFAISRLGWGLYRLFCNEVEMFEKYIVTGEFDSILVRPWPSLFVLVTRNFDVSRMMWLVQGIGVWAMCVPTLIARGTLVRGAWLHLLASVLWTALLFVAVGVATASAAFWIVRIDELSVFTMNASSSATIYPMDIYPVWFRTLFLVLIPIGAGNFVPVYYLLGKGGNSSYLVIPALAAFVSLAIALTLWRAGESRYHSTGS